jgi:hypothetical protein
MSAKILSDEASMLIERWIRNVFGLVAAKRRTNQRYKNNDGDGDFPDHDSSRKSRFRVS